MSNCILIEHDEVEEFLPVQKHFDQFGIEATPYIGRTSRLRWSRPLGVGTVQRAIKSSPLKCVSVTQQKPWCNGSFAKELQLTLFQF